MIEVIESEVISAEVTIPTGQSIGSRVKKNPRGLVDLSYVEHFESSNLFSQMLASPHHPQSGETSKQDLQSSPVEQSVFVLQSGPVSPARQEHVPSQLQVWSSVH